MTDPQLSIIIVNFNTKDDCVQCIQSVRDRITEIPYEVIVSDNGSSDGSAAAIREKFPWVTLIENRQNLGFGRANNIGAEHARGDVLFFLNPDTVIDHGIGLMYGYLKEHRDAGMIGPLVSDQNNKTSLFYPPVYSHLFLQITDLIAAPAARLVMTWKKYRYSRSIARQATFETGCIIGCAMMFRKDAYDAIRGFDGGIFMYGEEFDVCRRLRETGYRVMVFSRSRIIHFGGHSTKQIPPDFILRIGAQSLKRLLKKHFPRTWQIRYTIETLTHIRQALSACSKVVVRTLARSDTGANLAYARSHLRQYRLMREILREKE